VAWILASATAVEQECPGKQAGRNPMRRIAFACRATRCVPMRSCAGECMQTLAFANRHGSCETHGRQVFGHRQRPSCRLDGVQGVGGSHPLARASVPLSRGRGLYALTRPGYSGRPGALYWMAPGVYRQMCGWRVVGDTAVPACVSSRLRTPRRWSRLPPAARSPLLRYQPAGQTSNPTTSRGSQHSGPKTASRPARRW